MHAASNGRPVYEQVDEMEESASGQISLKLGDQTTNQDGRAPTGSSNMRVASPSYPGSNHVA